MCAVHAWLEFILKGIHWDNNIQIWCCLSSRQNILDVVTAVWVCFMQYLFHCCPTHYRYFSLQASEQLGLGDSVRLDVENKICDEHGPCMDSFAVPQKMAYEIMNKV